MLPGATTSTSYTSATFQEPPQNPTGSNAVNQCQIISSTINSPTEHPLSGTSMVTSAYLPVCNVDFDVIIKKRPINSNCNGVFRVQQHNENVIDITRHFSIASISGTFSLARPEQHLTRQTTILLDNTTEAVHASLCFKKEKVITRRILKGRPRRAFASITWPTSVTQRVHATVTVDDSDLEDYDVEICSSPVPFLLPGDSAASNLAFNSVILDDNNNSMQQADLAVEQRLAQIRRREEALEHRWVNNQQTYSNIMKSGVGASQPRQFPGVAEIWSHRKSEENSSSSFDEHCRSHQLFRQTTTSTSTNVTACSMGYLKRDHQGHFVHHQRTSVAHPSSIAYGFEDVVDETSAILPSFTPSDVSSEVVDISEDEEEMPADEILVDLNVSNAAIEDTDMPLFEMNVSFSFVKPPETAIATFECPATHLKQF